MFPAHTLASPVNLIGGTLPLPLPLPPPPLPPLLTELGERREYHRPP